MSVFLKIREKTDFNEGEKSIAKYILENYMTLKNQGFKEIAKNAYTSTASLTRFCKKLGYSGFKDFKIDVVEELAIMENKVIEFKNTDIEKDSTTKSIIEKLNSLSISTLNETKMILDIPLIEKVSKLIDEKQVIDFYGVGASHFVCLDAQYKFMRIGKVTNAFKGYDEQYIQAINSDNKRLSILVSYSGQTKEIVELAKILKRKGIETVSITRYASNSLSKICKTNLFVTSKEALKRSGAIYSRLAMLHLIDIIYFVYSNNHYDDVTKRLKETSLR